LLGYADKALDIDLLLLLFLDIFFQDTNHFLRLEFSVLPLSFVLYHICYTEVPPSFSPTSPHSGHYHGICHHRCFFPLIVPPSVFLSINCILNFLQTSDGSLRKKRLLPPEIHFPLLNERFLWLVLCFAV